MALDRGERSGLAHEDPRRVEGLTGRGNPFVTVGGGPGPSRDVARKYAAAVERGAAVGVQDMVGERGFEPPTPWSRNKGNQPRC